MAITGCTRCPEFTIIGSRDQPMISRQAAEHQAHEWCRTHQCADRAAADRQIREDTRRDIEAGWHG